MRLLILIIATFGLAALGTHLAHESASTALFLVKWQRAGFAAMNERPVVIFPRGALNDPSVVATLSHPIVADSLNTLFRAELSDGGDTVRFTAPNGLELAPPLKPSAGTGPLLRAMEQALQTAKRDVPEYLSLVAAEYAPAKQETARFAVSCYWKGEQKLGSLPGVIATRTGSMGADEVVEIRFDPTRVSREALTGQASSMACYQGERPAESNHTLDDSNQQQYHLWLHKSWHYVPLTQLQATRVNAALVSGESPERYLSPEQVEIHRKLQKALDRDPRALDDFEALKVDRTPGGINECTAKIVARIQSW